MIFYFPILVKLIIFMNRVISIQFLKIFKHSFSYGERVKINKMPPSYDLLINMSPGHPSLRSPLQISSFVCRDVFPRKYDIIGRRWNVRKWKWFLQKVGRIPGQSERHAIWMPLHSPIYKIQWCWYFDNSHDHRTKANTSKVKSMYGKAFSHPPESRTNTQTHTDTARPTIHI